LTQQQQQQRTRNELLLGCHVGLSSGRLRVVEMTGESSQPARPSSFIGFAITDALAASSASIRVVKEQQQKQQQLHQQQQQRQDESISPELAAAAAAAAGSPRCRDDTLRVARQVTATASSSAAPSSSSATTATTIKKGSTAAPNSTGKPPPGFDGKFRIVLQPHVCATASAAAMIANEFVADRVGNRATQSLLRLDGEEIEIARDASTRYVITPRLHALDMVDDEEGDESNRIQTSS
jgi:hypothetical protein